MLWPDTTYSTRPATWSRATLLLTRKCTTNAQCTDKGACPVWCCGVGSFRLQVSLVFGYVMCEEGSDRADRSHRKTLGKFWDFSRKPEREKMQPEQVLRFGPYQLDSRTRQLWRGTQEVRVTPKAAAVLRHL